LPNSGAQGEYGFNDRGRYHRRGDASKKDLFDSCVGSRNKPHFSAAMAGMKIIVTKTMENSNIVEGCKRKLSNIKTNILFNGDLPINTWCFLVPLEKSPKSYTTMAVWIYMDG
jgi:glycine cleavage system protein P-like pyridoxal-binding family